MFGLVTVKGALNYAVMPQIVPRLGALIAGGFNYIPYFIAVVYQMVGLLPRNHPYLKPESFGRFGVRHVVGQAAGNLTFNFKSIDQIILFVAVLVGLVLFFFQFFAIAMILFMQPVYAMPTNWNGFFVVAAPAQDLAYIMLDMVFGVPDPNGTANSSLFGSCVASTVVCQDTFTNPVADMDPLDQLPSGAAFNDEAAQMSPLASEAYLAFPFPFHLGIHQLFSVYSMGLLVIAVIVASYFIATILAETAQSGTPFGRRFNKMWAPLRIVVAFGLLIPLNVGLNSSQYIVLYAAKYGSAFATNGWGYFNTVLNDAYLNDGQALVSIPHSPDFDPLMQFIHVAKTCKVAHEYYTHTRLVNEGTIVATDPVPVDDRVWMYVIGPHDDTNPYRRVGSRLFTYDLLHSAYLSSIDEMTTLMIVFGVLDPDKHKEYPSFIKPVCGSLRMDLADPRAGPPANPVNPTNTEAEYGAFWSQYFYWNIIIQYWFDDGEIASIILDQDATTNHRHRAVVGDVIPAPSVNNPIHDTRVTDEFVRDLNEELQDDYEDLISGGITGMAGPIAQVMTNRIVNSGRYIDKGWAAAGIWYNRIAEMNGVVTSTMTNVPEVLAYPEILEKVYELKTKYDKNIDIRTRFEPTVASLDSTSSLLNKVDDAQFAEILWDAYEEWSISSEGQQVDRPKSNPFLQAISLLLGTDGLYDMSNNPTTHPLAQLSGVGRSLVESSVRSLGFVVMSLVATAAGSPKQLSKVIGSFFVTVAMLGLTVGFVLFYVVPFLPFIYFYFAVSGWIKGIFEALVGAPLWALAHIRIDGHGMSGQAALNGYFLIFEVFVRPILIVFGLLASISIYSALVSALNGVFTLVTENASGYDLESELETSRNTLTYMRSLIDEFFFTVIYAILVYMIGMSSFKLIDTVPNNILRWMGQSVATFGDQRENPAEGLVSRMSVGSQQVTSKIGGGLQAVVGAANRPGPGGK
ncbi:MAG: DotA/TraY family protein [Alphaproteobacteria bacterium]